MAWIAIACFSGVMPIQERGWLLTLEMKCLHINVITVFLVQFQLILNVMTGLCMNWHLRNVLPGSTLSRMEARHSIQTILANLLDKYIAKPHYFVNWLKITHYFTWSISLISKMITIISCSVATNVREVKYRISLI